MIPCLNPKAQYVSYKNEIDDAIYRVLNSGTYILGNEVKSFEKEFAEYIGTSYCVGVASGTDAIFLALKALDIGSGDEVIVPSFTAVPTVSAIVQCGAVPVFVDIEEEFHTIDATKISNAITQKTRAIICVHIYGQMCNMEKILDVAKKYNLFIIEDCAQATGSVYKGKKAGSFGDIGCFSFFPTKNLGAIGDGGSIVTNHNYFYDKLMQLRQYGWDKSRVSFCIGYNSRLDELQAAILRVKLKYLDIDIEKKKHLADLYCRYLKGVHLPKVRENTKHSLHLFVVMSKKRELLIKYLWDRDIACLVHYRKPVHQHPFFNKYKKSDLVVTEKLANEVISLPMFPELGLEDVKQISNLIGEFSSSE
jgi:dTDP-4-amino-4,6-dideoxygalactose transaminase